MCFVLNRANSLAGLTLGDISSTLGRDEIYRLPSVGAHLTRAVNDGRAMSADQFGRALEPLIERVRKLSVVGAGR